MNDDKKCCSKCGFVKSISLFAIKRSSKDGRSAACKKCNNILQRKTKQGIFVFGQQAVNENTKNIISRRWKKQAVINQTTTLEKTMNITDELIQQVWDLAKITSGKDSKIYRIDPYGTLIKRSLHGDKSMMGWQIDHIKPSSKGGGDEIENLQALQTSKNEELGNETSGKRSRHDQ